MSLVMYWNLAGLLVVRCVYVMMTCHLHILPSLLRVVDGPTLITLLFQWQICWLVAGTGHSQQVEMSAANWPSKLPSTILLTASCLSTLAILTPASGACTWCVKRCQ